MFLKMDNSDKIILDLCGGTGAWSKPYKQAGYKVKLITLPDYDITLARPHFFKTIRFEGSNHTIVLKCSDIYGILAAPPCTKFSKANWRVKKENRDFTEAMKVVRACMNVIWTVQECGAPLKFWALENPMGYLYNFLGRPVFYFQPWQFGDTSFLATKRTAIWGYFNAPAKTVRKRTVPFILSHSISKGTLRENKQWYSASAEERSITPPGFAQAFYLANK
jgi:hypothetical protein